MAFSDFGSTTSVRPDKPLIVKCTFDQRMKRITFASSRNCSYDLLRERVEQCFALSATPFTIRYKDDDGEVTDVTSDGDLTEAIHYFHAGDDRELPVDSASSIVSSRGRKVTLRLSVLVDYELSLSDTASLASLDDYPDDPNASDLTLAREPLNGLHGAFDFEPEDDAVTVSSRDAAAPPLRIRSRQDLHLPALSPVPSDRSPSPPPSTHTPTPPDYAPLLPDTAVASDPHVFDRLKRDDQEALAKRLSQTERGAQWLRDQNVRAIQSLFGALPEPSDSGDGDTEDGSLVFVGEVGEVYEEPGELGEGEGEGGPPVGDLALQQDPRGKYYYTYTSSSGASQAQEAASDVYQEREAEDVHGAPEDIPQEATYEPEQDGDTLSEADARQPSPHGLAWIADQRAHTSSSALAPITNTNSTTKPSTNTSPQPPTPTPTNPFSDPNPAPPFSDHAYQSTIHPDIPASVLAFIPEHRLPLAPPASITACSACGVLLESFRYVCTTCGEREARPRGDASSLSSSSSAANGAGKGKGKDVSTNPFLYPPHPHPHPHPPSPASSSWTLLNPPYPRTPTRTPSPAPPFPPRSSSLQRKPLPPPPRPYASSSQDTLHEHQQPSPSPSPFFPHLDLHAPDTGYELCSACIESAGVLHALEAGSGSPVHSNSSGSGSGNSSGNGNGSGNGPGNSPDSVRMRTAPRTKGHMRHAYREKVWGREGWKDVEQDAVAQCSICSAALATRAYKCASCPRFDLCRACYSQVHEIHPSHAFLSVPDQQQPPPAASPPERDPRQSFDINGELSLRHFGVKCHHCMLDIVGARFHCAVCDAVDICSNCESAGLPGNLTSPDGGHDSSHIMIKIPYPLASTEVETASRRAISLWHGRDRPGLQRRRRSSSQDRTVVGARGGHGHVRWGNEHHLPCRCCGITIVGIRYQCATCPSSPTSYNLCATCEIKSYLVHDPKHVFIKIPRALDRQIQTPYALLPPTLYSSPAGVVAGRRLDPRIDPRTYVQSLYHRTAVCDRCIEHIRGAWLHCAYCGSDLCEECESMGAHDSTHLFLVFKSMVNMSRLGEICNIENPSQSPPIIPHPVYHTS